MSEFTIRSESVDVEQIMKQIRSRILEKRGADYTEDQIRELASVRLEKFLEPKNLRSDLLEQFKKSRPAIARVPDAPPKLEPPYAFDDQTLFASHRGLMRFARKLFKPFLKLFFNPNTLNQILHTQAQFNLDMLKRDARRGIELQQQHAGFQQSRAEWNMLYYEVLHNMVLETTRMGIEVQNLRMKLESLGSRLDFSERRVRALEGVVQYRPEVVQAPPRREREPRDRDDVAPVTQASSGSGMSDGYVPSGGPGVSQAPGGQGSVPGDGSKRRRRRRRGRRGGAGAPGIPGPSGAAGAPGASGAAGESGAQGDYEEADGDDGPDEFEDAPDASASAREQSGELRRDSAEAASGREGEPNAPGAPAGNGGSSDDNGQQ